MVGQLLLQCLLVLLPQSLQLFLVGCLQGTHRRLVLLLHLLEFACSLFQARLQLLHGPLMLGLHLLQLLVVRCSLLVQLSCMRVHQLLHLLLV